MKFPKDILHEIKSFIPRDNNSKSPTSECIRQRVFDLYNEYEFKHVTDEYYNQEYHEDLTLDEYFCFYKYHFFCLR